MKKIFVLFFYFLILKNSFGQTTMCNFFGKEISEIAGYFDSTSVFRTKEIGDKKITIESVSDMDLQKIDFFFNNLEKCDKIIYSTNNHEIVSFFLKENDKKCNIVKDLNFENSTQQWNCNNEIIIFEVSFENVLPFQFIYLKSD